MEEILVALAGWVLRWWCELGFDGCDKSMRGSFSYLLIVAWRSFSFSSEMVFFWVEPFVFRRDDCLRSSMAKFRDIHLPIIKLLKHRGEPGQHSEFIDLTSIDLETR
jgi:hypothetical protein